MKITARTQTDHKEISSSKDLSILSLLHENDIYISAPCGGRGTCGKCKIKVLKGNLQVSKQDELYFTKEELNRGYRLACCALPKEDLEIMIESADEGFDIMTAYHEGSQTADSGMDIVEVSLEGTDWSEIKSAHLALEKKLDKPLHPTPKALRKLSAAFNKYNATKASKPFKLVMVEEKLIDVYYDEAIELYGIAIDIGTTTLGFQLIDLLTGKPRVNHSGLNSQRTFGADVITRIQNGSSGYLEKLNNLIVTDIVKGIENLLEKGSVDKRFIYKVAITGNTTMLHFLLGLNSETLGQYPFTSITNSLLNFDFSVIFNTGLLECEVVLLPCMDTYVGGDIVAGILHHIMFETDKISMLIDIGTNGEIVIGNRNSILATATAAGPALEGGNISCGIGCVNGAITSIKFKDGKFEYSVLGNGSPIGICGSGIIDIISEGLENGWIDETGHLSKEFVNGYISITDGESNNILFSQKDIREVQLAKSAVRSGIECLIQEYGTDYEEIDRVYLAGGFGSGIAIENAVRIGLIPRQLQGKIIISGNSSLGGAVKYLLDKKSRYSIEKVLNLGKTINLSMNPHFNNLFIENMFFKN